MQLSRKCCCRLSLMPTSLMIIRDDNNSYDVEPVPDGDPCSGHNLFQ